MYIIFIKNYKRKILILSSVLALGIIVFFLVSSFIQHSLIFKITINNYLTFSYPLSLRVDNIYIHEQYEANSIETNLTLRKPITQNFSSYQSLKGKFSFNYPSIFTLSQEDFGGSDILYHIDFKSKAEKNVHGFVQVWNMPYSLSEFLERSKSSSIQTFKEFTSSQILVNNLPGYLWEYIVVGNDDTNYKGMEVFFKKGDRMYRISYFVPENLWNKSQSDMFWGIVNSFKTY